MHQHGQKCCTADIVLCSLSPDSLALAAIEGSTSVMITDLKSSQMCGSKQCLSRRILATPYTAPEVGKGSYTAAADLWSLGGVVYWLLSGHAPIGVHTGRLYCHLTL